MGNKTEELKKIERLENEVDYYLWMEEWYKDRINFLEEVIGELDVRGDLNYKIITDLLQRLFDIKN